jgi:hypothetical protein
VGAALGNRTPDLRITSASLYPTELRRRAVLADRSLTSLQVPQGALPRCDHLPAALRITSDGRPRPVFRPRSGGPPDCRPHFCSGNDLTFPTRPREMA